MPFRFPPAPRRRLRPPILTPTQKLHVRGHIADYCARAEQNRLRWHYTQARPFHGYGVPPEQPHAADCSGYVSLAFNWAMHETGVYLADPLGERYTGWGYTGTMLAFLEPHPVPPTHKYLVGDVAIFGTARVTVHTIVCRKDGSRLNAVWSSNGHESSVFNRDAPEPITLEAAAARQPLFGVYRHPALL